MGIMSLIARCVDCGAQNTTIKNGTPSDWIMYGKVSVPCAVPEPGGTER